MPDELSLRQRDINQQQLASEPEGAAWAFDSFDDHLEWIIGKLTERAAGTFGLIFRYLSGEAGQVVIATCALGPRPAQTEIECMTFKVRAEEMHASSDEALVRRLDCRDGLECPVRLLYMVFRPAPGVTIIAAVCRPVLSLNLLQELVAARLHPVLARYVQMWWLHRTERRRAFAYQHALQVADLGVVMLDSHGDVLFTNRTADRLLSEQDGLTRSGYSISAAKLRDWARLQLAIRHAMQCNLAPREAGDVRFCAPVLAMPRSQGRRPLMVTVTSVSSSSIDRHDAAVILYLVDPDRDVRVALTAVYRVYKLTAAESRLVDHLVQGSSITEAAKGMNVTLQTGRGYLKQVFHKTGTTRQSELIRVLRSSACGMNGPIDLTFL